MDVVKLASLISNHLLKQPLEWNKVTVNNKLQEPKSQLNLNIINENGNSLGYWEENKKYGIEVYLENGKVKEIMILLDYFLNDYNPSAEDVEEIDEMVVEIFYQNFNKVINELQQLFSSSPIFIDRSDESGYIKAYGQHGMYQANWILDGKVTVILDLVFNTYEEPVMLCLTICPSNHQTNLLEPRRPKIRKMYDQQPYAKVCSQRPCFQRDGVGIKI